MADERVVVITGAASGIGRATALRFAEEGCKVAVWDVNEDGKEELLRQLEESPGEGLFQNVDVSDAEDVNGSMQAVRDLWEPCLYTTMTTGAGFAAALACDG